MVDVCRTTTTAIPRPALAADFEADSWRELRSAMGVILTGGTCSFSREELYTTVEDLCAEGYGAKLYKRVVEEVDEQAAVKVGRLAALDLEDDIIQEAAKEWRNHTTQTLAIRSIFAYLDRSVAFRQKGTLGLWDAGVAGLSRAVCNNDTVLQRLVTYLLAVANRQRSSEEHEETDELRDTASCCSMLSALRLYERAFERPLLAEAADFYAADGERLASSSSSTDAATRAITFARVVEARRREIGRACELYLEKSTAARLEDVLKKRLVEPQIAKVWREGFEGLLQRIGEDEEASSREALKVLFDLLASAKLQVEAKKQIKIYAKSRSVALLEETTTKRPCPKRRRMSDGGSSDEEEDGGYLEEARLLVESVVGLYERVESVCVSFGDGTVEALKSGIEEALNEEGRRGSVFAESLAAFAHCRCVSASQKILEKTTTTLFRLARSKDVFEAFSRKHLASRLLASGADIESERGFIATLEGECGASYVAKLEGMCKDMDLAKAVMDDYKQDDSMVELCPTVLTTGYWPRYPAASELKLTPELEARQTHFSEHYSSKFQGRRLAWQQSSFDTCILKAHSSSKTKDIEATLSQAMVLCCFDGSSTKMSFKAIGERTNLEDDELQRVLASLSGTSKQILQRDNNSYTVHISWGGPLMRAQLPKENPANLPNVAADREKLDEAVAKDRQYAVDAAAVRLMKSRKTLSHHDLVAELMKTLVHPTTPALIKQRIESLIDRDYIERDIHDTQPRYNYLA